jgi:hypothetical protein
VHYGFPFCYGPGLPDPAFNVWNSCANFTSVAASLAAHAAALGVQLYTGSSFPPVRIRCVRVSVTPLSLIGTRVGVPHDDVHCRARVVGSAAASRVPRHHGVVRCRRFCDVSHSPPFFLLLC